MAGACGKKLVAQADDAAFFYSPVVAAEEHFFVNLCCNTYSAAINMPPGVPTNQ